MINLNNRFLYFFHHPRPRFRPHLYPHLQLLFQLLHILRPFRPRLRLLRLQWLWLAAGPRARAASTGGKVRASSRNCVCGERSNEETGFLVSIFATDRPSTCKVWEKFPYLGMNLILRHERRDWRKLCQAQTYAVEDMFLSYVREVKVFWLVDVEARAAELGSEHEENRSSWPLPPAISRNFGGKDDYQSDVGKFFAGYG
ncbi:hypothetical protein FS842_009178 [Serendipita sp. 407]|nr:hypothetical protein FS842_009178 [Serendipita sp. 407]